MTTFRDSGQRAEFGTGAVRDIATNKGRSVLVNSRKLRVGDRYGSLEVIGVPFRVRSGPQSKTCAVCRCDCGDVLIVRYGELKFGQKGCKHCSLSAPRPELRKWSHRVSDPRLYQCWFDMKRRCYDEKCKDFHHYGGRGIRVCDAWMDDFDVFAEWALSHGYRDADLLTIDRINVNGIYEPSNCRWTTRDVQSQNRRVR